MHALMSVIALHEFSLKKCQMMSLWFSPQPLQLQQERPSLLLKGCLHVN